MVESFTFAATSCRAMVCQNQDFPDFRIDRIETFSLWDVFNLVNL